MDRSTLAALALVMAGCVVGPPGPPTDAAMRARFQELRGALDSLVVADFAQVAHRRRLGTTFDSYGDSVSRRWMDRRTALLGRIGSQGAENLSPADSSLHVPVWVGGDEEKGYAYCRRPPGRLVGSLDSRRSLGRHPGDVVIYHRHVDGPWYVYRGTHVGS